MAEYLDKALAALADPTRRRIVELLSGGPVRSGDLAAGVGLPPTTITRHLRTLRDAGVVEVDTAEGDARGRLYRLGVEQITRLQVWAVRQLASPEPASNVTGIFDAARVEHPEPITALSTALSSLPTSVIAHEALTNLDGRQATAQDMEQATAEADSGRVLRAQIAQLVVEAAEAGQLTSPTPADVVALDLYTAYCGALMTWGVAPAGELSDWIGLHIHRALSRYRPNTADDADIEEVQSTEHHDPTAFTAAAEPLRHELRLHCYRMTGALDESEDLVQETLLRAWRAWPRFRGESSVRTWLYRIATNVCLSSLQRSRRQTWRSGEAKAESLSTWPYPEPIPDRLLVANAGTEQPDDRLVERETVELAFVTALQVLSPRQRAVFIMRDVLGLPASDTAEALDIGVPATKSVLQRARAAMRDALSDDRTRWPAPRATRSTEWAITKRYVAAIEERDGDAMAELLHEDLRVRYLPRGLEVNGRSVFIDGSARYAPAGEFRYLETSANGQPAIAVYLRPPEASEFRRLSLAVLRVAGDRIVEIVDFSDPHLLETFALPASLSR